MSTRSGGRPSGRNSIKSVDSDTSISGLRAMDSTSSFKATLKKKKKATKWQPFDLSDSAEVNGSEVGSEAASASASMAPTRTASPNPILTFAAKQNALFPYETTPLSRSLSGFTTAGFEKDGVDEKEDIEYSAVGLENIVGFRGPQRQTDIHPFPHHGIDQHLGQADTAQYHTPLANNFRYSDPYSPATHSSFDPLFPCDFPEFDNDPTPRAPQGFFDCFNPAPESPDFFDDDTGQSDSQSTKDRTEAALSRIHQSIMVPMNSNADDAFDSVDWDPELPSAPTPGQSPEPVTIKPQVVAYTTVGSLVDPTAVPQFAAPNRIQREGANRRPLMPLAQPRNDSFYQPRGPPPSLNMANSMHYAQQLGRAPGQVNGSGASNAGQVSGPAPPAQLTDEEKEQVVYNFSGKTPFAYAGNLVHTSSTTATQPYKWSTYGGMENEPIQHSFSVKEMAEEDSRGRSNSFQALQGMEKMQTLQRLAKFENPLQEQAKARLSVFKFKEPDIPNIANKIEGFTSHVESMLRQSSMSMSSVSDDTNRQQGELNRGYQFPPPGLAGAQPNPLLAASHTTGCQSNIPLSRPPGYPQPLTAGPPGQRQLASNPSQLASHRSQPAYIGNEPKDTPYGPTEAAWAHLMRDSRFTTAPAPVPTGSILVKDSRNSKSQIYDTLPSDEAMTKYFSHGLPGDFNDTYTPLSPEARKAMGQDEEDRLTLQQLAEVKQQKFDNIHYEGQRRYATMLHTDDYITELEERQPHTASNPYGIIGPPKKVLHPITPQPITPSQASILSTADATAPLMTALFGTMLAYAHDGPTSRRNLMGFGKSSPELIDASKEGNATLFGEDWGAPKRKGDVLEVRSSRYLFRGRGVAGRR